jgi:hypothetical protein
MRHLFFALTLAGCIDWEGAKHQFCDNNAGKCAAAGGGSAGGTAGGAAGGGAGGAAGGGAGGAAGGSAGGAAGGVAGGAAGGGAGGAAGGSAGGAAGGAGTGGGGSSICTGVHCNGQATCDPTDAYCKCNGQLCASGATCTCAGSQSSCAESMKSCVTGTPCVGVTCGGGTTCDPTDGLCKCGGPGGPACAMNQICALGPPPTCMGGSITCSPPCTGGTSCDSTVGVCKCGGVGGAVCTGSEICVAAPFAISCKRPCDVRAPTCPTGTFCYWDETALGPPPSGYCSAPTGTQPEQSACISATACFVSSPAHALHCAGVALGQFGTCHSYCDVAAGTAGCLQVPVAQVCTQISGAPAGYGYCQP